MLAEACRIVPHVSHVSSPARTALLPLLRPSPWLHRCRWTPDGNVRIPSRSRMRSLPKPPTPLRDPGHDSISVPFASRTWGEWTGLLFNYSRKYPMCWSNDIYPIKIKGQNLKHVSARVTIPKSTIESLSWTAIGPPESALQGEAPSSSAMHIWFSCHISPQVWRHLDLGRMLTTACINEFHMIELTWKLNLLTYCSVSE